MQDYAPQTIRAAAILTGSHVAGTSISPLAGAGLNPANHNQLQLLVDFTIGSLTTGEVKVEFSHDGTNWYQDTFLSIDAATATASAGVYQFASTGKYILNIPIKCAHIRISAKGNGTATGSSMAILAILGTV